MDTRGKIIVFVSILKTRQAHMLHSLSGSFFDFSPFFLYNEFIVLCFPFNCYVCTQDCKPTRKQGTPRASVPMILRLVIKAWILDPDDKIL